MAVQIRGEEGRKSSLLDKNDDIISTSKESRYLVVFLVSSTKYFLCLCFGHLSSYCNYKANVMAVVARRSISGGVLLGDPDFLLLSGLIAVGIVIDRYGHQVSTG